uniref:Vanillin dehydrogenase n=1 Tax=Pseudomonas putida TaxID=303 RepID=O54034_PSEPU|nr:vanillin dehydrogenase [Pseudomonas putida]
MPIFEVPLLIGGMARAASDGGTFERRHPVSGDLVSVCRRHPGRADAAVEAAQAAFPAWAALGPGDGRARLLKAADALDARRDEFLAMAEETGAKANWYGFNVMLAANILREAASMTTQDTGRVIPSDVPGSFAMALRQPCGVVLGIRPWNAPVILGHIAIAMPGRIVSQGLRSQPGGAWPDRSGIAGGRFGDGVVNVICNAPHDAPAVVERLIAHPAVRRVNFTGSTHVGRIVGQLAARHLKPAVLELGGKAPFLVLADADLEAAVDAAAFPAYFNQGQICMSTERLIVDQAVADEFVAKLGEKVRRLRAADPSQPDAPLGSLIDAGAGERIQALVDDAVGKGATLVAGGERTGSVMHRYCLTTSMRALKLYREESFGPVAVVLRASGHEGAAGPLANDSEFGLSAAIFSRDTQRALALAQRLESGICHINGPTVHDEATMPFGGVKASGFGRFGRTAAIDAFTQLRWDSVQHGAAHYPI